MIGDGSTGDGPPSFSCLNLPSTCGPLGTSPCCGSKHTPGGMFNRTYDVGTDNMFSDPSYPATVSDFWLDTYEVTVGRFRQFVNAGKGTQADPPPAGAGARPLNGLSTNQAGWDSQWNGDLFADTATLVQSLNCDAQYQSWTDTPGNNESMPMNCISWFEAFAFCAWDGGFLPTEAQWNYAAVAGSEHRAYPWSSPPSSLTIDCTYATYDYCLSTAGTARPVGTASPRGDGRWGHVDLAGNVQEWTLDATATYYLPCNDCANTTFVTGRMFRGGSFDSAELGVRGAYRLSALPNARNFNIGVRCARR